MLNFQHIKHYLAPGRWSANIHRMNPQKKNAQQKKNQGLTWGVCWWMCFVCWIWGSLLFHGGSDGKKYACKPGDPVSIPGSGRSLGEGNGNPLQYYCLENPMDRGAWQTTVHEVAKSWTRLRDWHTLIFQRRLLWVASWAVVVFVQVNWIKVTLRSFTWFFCEFINKWTKSKKSGELFTFYSQMLITYSAIIGGFFFNVYLFIWLCCVLVVAHRI